MIKKAIKAALPHTIPVLAGFIFLGIAFGFLVVSKGYPLWYPIFMSVVIYTGALEFAVIPMLASPLEPLSAFIMGLMVSARHLFYGIPLLKKYENSGKLKFLLMFTLTDESFSINSSIDPPEGIEGKYFYAAISFLNYGYWISGTAIGAVFGNLISFDTTGIDFALTALFIVLFMEQIRTKTGLISGLTGLFVTAVVLIIAGSENMVIISMIVLLFVLMAGRRAIDRE